LTGANVTIAEDGIDRREDVGIGAKMCATGSKRIDRHPALLRVHGLLPSDTSAGCDCGIQAKGNSSPLCMFLRI
jgi:hypothetical protein